MRQQYRGQADRAAFAAALPRCTMPCLLYTSLSPVMLFVLGCGIYSVVRASWTDVFLLTLIEMGLFAAAVGAGGIMELMERL